MSYYQPQRAITPEGLVAPGARAEFYLAGTAFTESRNVFHDPDLQIDAGSVVVADGAGLFAPVYFGEGSYAVRYTDALGQPIGYAVEDIGVGVRRLADATSLLDNTADISRADLDDGSVWINDGTTGNDPQLADGAYTIVDASGRLWTRALPATLEAPRTITVEPGATGLQDALTEIERNTIISADASGYAEVEGARQTLVLPSDTVEFDARTLSAGALRAVRIEGPSRVADRAVMSAQFNRRVDTFTVTAGQTVFPLTALWGKPRRGHDLVVYENGTLKEPETDNGGAGGSLGGAYQLNEDGTAIVADNWAPTEGATVEIIHGYDLEFDVVDFLSEYRIGGMVKLESLTCTGADGNALRKTVWPIRNINGNRIIVRLNSMRVAPLDIGTISALAVRPLPSVINMRSDGSTDVTRNIYGFGAEVPVYLYRANLRFEDTWHDFIYGGALRNGYLGVVDSSLTFGPKHGLWNRDGGSGVYNNTFVGFMRENGVYVTQGGPAQCLSVTVVGAGVGLRGSGGYADGNSFKAFANRVGVSTEGGSRLNLPFAHIACNGLDIDLQSAGDYVDVSGGTVGRSGDTHTTIRVRKGAVLNAKNATLYGTIVIEQGGTVLASGAGGSYTIQHTLAAGTTSDLADEADALGGGFFVSEATVTLAGLKIINNLPELVFEDVDSSTTSKIGAASGNLYHITSSTARDNFFGHAGDIGLFQMDNSAEALLVDGSQIAGATATAIADSDGTAADNQRAINAILAEMRAGVTRIAT